MWEHPGWGTHDRVTMVTGCLRWLTSRLIDVDRTTRSWGKDPSAWDIVSDYQSTRISYQLSTFPDSMLSNCFVGRPTSASSKPGCNQRRLPPTYICNASILDLGCQRENPVTHSFYARGLMRWILRVPAVVYCERVVHWLARKSSNFWFQCSWFPSLPDDRSYLGPFIYRLAIRQQWTWRLMWSQRIDLMVLDLEIIHMKGWSHRG